MYNMGGYVPGSHRPSWVQVQFGIGAAHAWHLWPVGNAWVAGRGLGLVGRERGWFWCGGRWV